MTELFRDCSETVQRLSAAVHALEHRAAQLQLPTLRTQEWHELLRQKLVPQLGDHAFLVVAVVGGTNIGKSVIFNHIAGFAASSVSPLASGTKHPVCLAPPGFVEEHDLQKVFADFSLQPWSNPDLALKETSQDLLFWKSSEATPANLLVLDTPDIDSDAPVNWDRADKIRRSADVLIAVLTQQKYNDAAVKQFFRKAAAEEKAIIVVFNQCDLPEDEQYWPLWLDKFCSETEILPEFVYLAPRDKSAAGDNRLPFYERRWPPAAQAAGNGAADRPHNLMQDLSQLHFSDIKLRTLRGSLRHLLDPSAGVPLWLEELRRRSNVFRSATEHLAENKLAGSDHWPVIPNRLLVTVIRNWWRTRREGWSRSVHEFYNTVGEGVLWPFRKIRDSLQGPSEPPLEVYRRQEWTAILEAVEHIFERLEFMARADQPVLSERLKTLLDGKSRSDLIRLLENAHAAVDFEAELNSLIAREMETFQHDSPNFYSFLKNLDQLAAVVRPATSIALFVLGFGPAGDAAAQLAAHSAMHTVVQLAGDVAGGTAAAAVGDTALSSTASSLSGTLEAHFRALHAAFVSSRLEWLLNQLQQHLWGTFLDELKLGSELQDCAEFTDVESILDELRARIATLEDHPTAPSPRN